MRLFTAPIGVRVAGRPLVIARASPSGFPKDYSAVVRDAQEATKRAMQDGLRLLEVEFPVASLMAVQGDEEGANEMTKSSEYLRQYARAFLEVASSTRVFFPDVKESELQASGVWADFPSINLDYLTKPSGLLDIGIDLSGYSPTSKIKPGERVFMAAYPSFDPRELVAVDKVWRHIQNDEDKTLVIFNAELCRLRSDYFPKIFYPEMARLSKELIPAVETVYYVRTRNPDASNRYTPDSLTVSLIRASQPLFARCTISRVPGVACSSVPIRVRGRCSCGYRAGILCSCTNRTRGRASARSVWTSFPSQYETFSARVERIRDCGQVGLADWPKKKERHFMFAEEFVL